MVSLPPMVSIVLTDTAGALGLPSYDAKVPAFQYPSETPAEKPKKKEGTHDEEGRMDKTSSRPSVGHAGFSRSHHRVSEAIHADKEHDVLQEDPPIIVGALLTCWEYISEIKRGRARKRMRDRIQLQDKYGSVSCANYEIDVRATTDTRDMQHHLERIMHVQGPQRCISFAGNAGVIYQKTLHWLSIIIIALASLQAAMPDSCRSEDFLATGWVACANTVYFLCSIMFALLALPARLLFTVVSLPNGQEWSSLDTIFNWMKTSPGVWLDLASVMSFIIQRALWLANVEYAEPLRLVLLAAHMLCGWHSVAPIVRATTQRVNLASELMNLLVLLVMCVHIIACVWALLSNLENDAGVVNWASATEGETSCDMYVTAFYFMGYTLTTTGYGDVLPANEFEQVLSVFVMIIGTCMLAQTRASLNWITNTSQSERFEHMSKVSRIASALESLGIQGVLSTRIFAFLEYTSLCHMESGVLRHLDNLSSPLRAEFYTSRHDNLLKRSDIFKPQSREVLHLLVQKLQDRVYLPNDYVFAEGDTPHAMYFVRIGKVLIENRRGSVQSSESPTDTLNQSLQSFAAGELFGEVGVFTGQARPLTARALCYCILSALSREVFEDMQRENPQAFMSIFKSVQSVLQMMAKATWRQLSAVLISRFGDREAAFQALLPKGANGVLAMGRLDGQISMARFSGGMIKLGVPTVEARMLWMDIEFEEGEDRTVLTYDTFMRIVTEVPKEECEAIVEKFHAQYSPDNGADDMSDRLSTNEEADEARSDDDGTEATEPFSPTFHPAAISIS